MDIERLKKIAGLNESLESEIKRAEIERSSESEESPSFKGLLSEPTHKSADFDFLKSLRRKETVEEDGPNLEKPYEDKAKEDDRYQSNYIQAQDHFDDAFGVDYVKTEEGSNEINQQLMSYMSDNMINPKDELTNIQDWADHFEEAWNLYEDEVLSQHGTEYIHDDDTGTIDYYHYSELKLSDYYENYFANEFAKWATAKYKILIDAGWPKFPDVMPGQFANLVKPVKKK